MVRKLPFKIGKRQLTILQKLYKTDSAMAKVLGVSAQYIGHLRRKFNMELHKSADVIANRNKLIYTDHKIKKIPVSELSRNYKLSRMTIYRIINSGGSS